MFRYNLCVSFMCTNNNYTQVRLVEFVEALLSSRLQSQLLPELHLVFSYFGTFCCSLFVIWLTRLVWNVGNGMQDLETYKTMTYAKHNQSNSLTKSTVTNSLCGKLDHLNSGAEQTQHKTNCRKARQRQTIYTLGYRWKQSGNEPGNHGQGSTPGQKVKVSEMRRGIRLTK